MKSNKMPDCHIFGFFKLPSLSFYLFDGVAAY